MPEALLVDDDVAFLAALSDALARENFATRTATSLAAARSEIAGSAPDVILVDVNLPDGSGMDLLEAVGALPATEIVFITGQASVETAVEALRKGAADYLVKPVDLARVKTVLANVSRTRELKRLAGLPWARREPGAPLPSFGRYEVEAEIGEGSMGRVFRCRDPLVGRLVAVKTIKSEYLGGDTRDDYLRRFKREAQAAGILSHPSIVGIFDVGDDYIVMEHVEGATLHQLLRDGQPLDSASALRILAPLADALDYAHRAGVIHRDIKPANITVQPDGRPKLMDFGVARLESATATGTGHVFGSPSYMAPEQILGAALTPQADLFSFAVVAYEALTGGRPFHGDSVASIVYRIVHEAPPPPSRANPLLPASYDAVFARALARDPAQRYPDAATFVAALECGEAEAPPDPPLASLVAAVAQHSSEAAPVAGAVAETAALAVEPAGPRRRWRHLAASLALLAVFPMLLWARRPARQGDASWRPLHIETQPAGMPVWINGLQAGRAPLTRPLPPGTHRIRVVEEGYAPAELTVDLVAGTTAAPLRFVMSRLRTAAATSPAAVEGAPPFAVDDARRDDRRPEGAGGRSRTEFWTRLATPEPPATVPAVAAPAPAPPLRDGDLVEMTEGVQPPRRVAGETPRYPEEARRLGLSGSVLTEVLVSQGGWVEEVRVLESAGAILDEAVVGAVSGWRFEPAVRDGVKVRVRWTYRHTFTRR